MVLGPKHIRDSLSNNIVNLDGIVLASSTTVKNLGVILYQEQISRTVFFQLCNFAKILQKKYAEDLVHTFINYRHNYCNKFQATLIDSWVDPEYSNMGTN